MKNKRNGFVMTLLLTIALLCISSICYAVDLKIAIMQDAAGDAKKFKPLLDYMSEKVIAAEFVSTKDYPSAAKMFRDGSVNAMFSGSGIAGTMIIKDLAAPLVRPVSKDGYSTYWAVVIAPKGSSHFDGKADYFKDKKVIFASLASSGEFYFHSIEGSTKVGAKIMNAPSHGAALDTLSRGVADIAIVKNRVWDKEKSKYANLELVGEDHGENPDGTLIVSKNIDPKISEKISTFLLGLKDDDSPKAREIKDSLGIQGYIKTTKDDFKHNLELLGKAGVTKDFNFKY